jgi:septal ring factor EnvC (AmiA/AmiB activator)
MTISVTITDPRDLSDRQQLLLLLERISAMSQVAADTQTAVTALDSKVDALIAAVTPAVQALRDQLAAAQAQLAGLQADAAADVTTLQGTIAAAQNEAAKVDAAIQSLGSTTPAPVAG